MTGAADETAVLLLAYGGPLSLADVEPYLQDVRHGRGVPADLLEEVKERYRLIGGKSPLLEITRRQANALERRLREQGLAVRTFVGMRHWHPYVSGAVQDIAASGLKRIVAVCMAPQYSRMSIGAYREKLEAARKEIDPSLQVQLVDNWHLEPHFLRCCAENLQEGLSRLGGSRGVAVLFTAHSLPERIVSQGDPYAAQLRETVEAVLRLAPVEFSSFAFQSAGRTADRWLGPDAGDEIDRIHSLGLRKLLLYPIGFVADHVEILYDDDILYRGQAQRLGMDFYRVRSCNDAPLFIESLLNTVLPLLKA